MKKQLFTIIMIMYATCASMLFTSCDPDFFSNDISGGSLKYVDYNGITYFMPDRNNWGGPELSICNDCGVSWSIFDRYYMWTLDLPYREDGMDNINDHQIFYIFSKDVKAGFEFTESNFVAESGWNDYRKDSYFTKHSGLGRVVKMNNETAVLEFKNFVMRHLYGGKNEIVLDGTVTINVNSKGGFHPDYIDFDGMTMIKNGRYLCVDDDHYLNHLERYAKGLYDEENNKTFYGNVQIYGESKISKSNRDTVLFYLLTKDVKPGMKLSNETIFMGGFYRDNYRIKSGTGKVLSITDSYAELEFDNLIFEQTDGVGADIILDGRSKIKVIY